MPCNNSSSADSLHKLSQLKPTQEENAEEERTAATESSRSVERLAIEERANDETVGDDDEDLCPEGGRVTKNEPELTLGTGDDLTGEADCVGRRLGNVLRLALLHGTLELLRVGKVGFLNVLFVGSHVFEESLVVRRAPEGLLEFFGSLGCAAFPAWAETTLHGIGDGSQEIRSGLSGGTLEAKVDEVLLGLACGTHEDLAARIDHQDLVHHVVNSLTSLVKSDKRSAVRNISHDSQRSGVVKSSRCIETSGRVIPGNDSGFGSQCFGDGNTLPFTSRDTADVLVTNHGVLGVRDTEHLHECSGDDIDLLTGLFPGLGHEGESESLPDVHDSHVRVIFAIVNDFTTVHLLLLFCR